MRLIDADALYREYQEKVCDGIACHECKATNKDGTCKLDSFISTAPTIDAVEVVRCRECKHFVDEGFYCAQNILPMFDHFYCYYGERSER